VREKEAVAKLLSGDAGWARSKPHRRRACGNRKSPVERAYVTPRPTTVPLSAVSFMSRSVDTLRSLSELRRRKRQRASEQEKEREGEREREREREGGGERKREREEQTRG